MLLVWNSLILSPHTSVQETGMWELVAFDEEGTAAILDLGIVFFYNKWELFLKNHTKV